MGIGTMTLRQLRKYAGLTQTELAATRGAGALGPHRWYHNSYLWLSCAFGVLHNALYLHSTTEITGFEKGSRKITDTGVFTVFLKAKKHDARLPARFA